MKDTNTVQTVVNAPMERVLDYWNRPEYIIHWPLLRMTGKRPLPVTICKSVESSKSQWLPKTRALVLTLLVRMISDVKR